MTTIEAFYCPTCDAIVRGKMAEESHIPDSIVIVTGLCSLCEGKVSKTIQPESDLTYPEPPKSITPALRRTTEEEYNKIQKKIDQKEEVFTRLLEQFYEGDPEYARQLDPDLHLIAILKGDTEYEQLQEKRMKLMWVVEPKAELVE